tara:strand:+ start:2523 stop:3521 length:999 start_codon:yes stop_codon:yes gene_type:complete
MIVKNYEIKKINFKNSKFFLLYGDNEGFKNEVIDLIISEKKIKKTLYYEKEILEDVENFTESLISKSFFESEKLLIVKNASDKIKDLIEKIQNKNLDEITIILDAELLEKKSKLRSYFEKERNLICIPFYQDEIKDLNYIAQKYLREKKIKISQESINLIIERSNGSRLHLKKELEKIFIFSIDKKEVKIEDTIRLTNLGKNYNLNELVDASMAKNKSKLIKIINENSFSNEDIIILIRIFLTKAKRLLQLNINSRINKNLEFILSSYKPPIFWKEKEVLKKQLKIWGETDLRNLIKEINNTELMIKKNTNISNNILFNFILKNSMVVNNGS